MDRKKAKIAYIWHNFHMQETNYVLVTIYSLRQSLSQYILASLLRKLWFFLYLLDLAFIPLDNRKLLKNQIQNHRKKKYLLLNINIAMYDNIKLIYWTFES